jgi:hypothetical protein
MIAVWVGLSTGLTSNLARAMGARDEARIQQALATTWRLVFWVMPLFLLVGAACWVLAPRIAGSPPWPARSPSTAPCCWWARRRPRSGPWFRTPW